MTHSKRTYYVNIKNRSLSPQYTEQILRQTDFWQETL